MPRYAMIELYSGYIWGVQTASDPVTACRLMDCGANEFNRTYDEHGPNSGQERQGGDGYLVHETPDNFEAYNGQDKREIDVVTAMPRVAIVLTGEDVEGEEDKPFGADVLPSDTET